MNTRLKIALVAAVSASVAAVAAVTLAGGGAEKATATVPPDTSEPTGEVTEDAMDRSITVTGHGTVKVTPDVADLWLGVQSTADTGEAAMSTIETKSQQLVNRLKELGIPAEDIQTSNLSLYPNYGQNGRTINGYSASVDVSVRARQIDRIGELLDSVQGLVGDELTIGGISFSYEDPEAVLEQARITALENARARAGQYAAAAGVEVGEIVKIVETPIGDAIPYMMEARELAADSGAAIEPGSQELVVDVTVVFAMA
jgi:uncharacterized protein YggE